MRIGERKRTTIMEVNAAGMKRLTNRESLTSLREALKRDMAGKKDPSVKVCCGTACRATGSLKVLNALEKECREKDQKIDIVTTGCQGLCEKGPLMKIEPHGLFYHRVNETHVPRIVANTLAAGFPLRDLLYRDSFLTDPVEKMEDVPFYKKQHRLVLRNNTRLDPGNIFQYIAYDGYAAFEKALFSMSPIDVVLEMKNSGLRGRGGAGFPTGVKWEASRRASGKVKMVIANGDEGDPGAFMDRSIMEGDPHSVLEGMLICAYATGARYGFIYVRHEYPLAVRNLAAAIRQAEELGLLGRDILGTGFSFDISIREGAGAFVCGEETSLIASIEGARGFPSQKPPFPAEKGLWGFPTCINNIETLANISYIILHGSENFSALGTEGSKGTKVFALTGKIRNTGLIEVPMGITLREIIYDIGGGIPGNKKLKAIQTGGPSGGCIPAGLIDLQVDFDSLLQVGSMMGSGGLVVMDEDTCMVDVAKYFLAFTQQESCGKCPPCRIGTYQLLQILERITQGQGQPSDLEQIEQLCYMIKEGSLCGLGKTAPNPVLSTLHYFREEYEEHVLEKYCSARVCKGLGAYEINHQECLSCGLCKDACAHDAITESRSYYHIDHDHCVKCRACYEACPIKAVKVSKKRYLHIEKTYKISTECVKTMERRNKMTLGVILSTKTENSERIISVGKGASVAEAVTVMHNEGISGIFVSGADGEILGIFTECDLKRCVAGGTALGEIPVEAEMHTDLVTFHPSTEIGAAIAIAMKKRIRHLPVAEGNRVIGMITFRDLVSYLLPEVCYLSESL